MDRFTFAIRSARWFAATVLFANTLVAQEPANQQATSEGASSVTTAGEVLFVTSAYAMLTANQLGIEVTPVEGALQSQLGIEGGLVINTVPEGSEGAEAGLQPHDVILNINGPRSEPVRDIEKLKVVLNENAGKKIEIGLLRAGKMQLIEAHVPERQELQPPTTVAVDLARPLNATAAAPDRYRIGVSLADADETLRAQLQLPSGEGFVVTEVLPGTPAERSGLKSHDVLIELGGKRLKLVEQLNQQIQETKSAAVALKFLRGGKEETIEITPEKVAPEHDPQTFDFRAHAHPELTGMKLQFIPHTNSYFAFSQVTAAPDPASIQAQIAKLKHQLAEMQQTLASVEAALSAADKKSPAESEPRKK